MSILVLQQVRSRSRSAEDEALERPPEAPSPEEPVMGNLQEGDEEEEEDDEEEETATEVEVSEKTLKFKISTESGRKSYPGSRKGSRDKNQLCGEFPHQELARAVRDIQAMHFRSQGPVAGAAPARSSLATSPLSGRSLEFSRCNGEKENKCLSFEDDTLSRSSHSPCSGLGSKRGSNATRSPLPPRDSTPLPETQPQVAVAPTLGPSPKLRSPSSFLKKLKNLTDRLSFSVSGDREPPLTSPCHSNCQLAGSATCPASPLLLQDYPQGSSPAARHSVDSLELRDSLRSTLPKTRGPRGWRCLLGAEPPERRRQSSVNACPPDASPGEHLADHSSGVSLSDPAIGDTTAGSLESILHKSEPTGNNNNRKKATLWGSPGSRRVGFLTRLATNKQSEDSINSQSAPSVAPPEGSGHGSGSDSGSAAGSASSGTQRQQGIIASLAASFRPRKSPASSPSH